jgi:hypothetical protein
MWAANPWAVGSWVHWAHWLFWPVAILLSSQAIRISYRTKCMRIRRISRICPDILKPRPAIDHGGNESYVPPDWPNYARPRDVAAD